MEYFKSIFKKKQNLTELDYKKIELLNKINDKMIIDLSVDECELYSSISDEEITLYNNLNLLNSYNKREISFVNKD